MGQVSFHSQEIILQASPSEVYTSLADLDNMEHLIPEQVINWKSNSHSCSFEIKGMAKINLHIGELIENQLVTIDSSANNPIQTQFLFKLDEAPSNQFRCVITLNAELSMMLQMLASTPLQNLVNIMAEKLGEVFGGK